MSYAEYPITLLIHFQIDHSQESIGVKGLIDSCCILYKNQPFTIEIQIWIQYLKEVLSEF